MVDLLNVVVNIAANLYIVDILLPMRTSFGKNGAPYAVKSFNPKMCYRWTRRKVSVGCRVSVCARAISIAPQTIPRVQSRINVKKYVGFSLNSGDRAQELPALPAFKNV